MPIPKPDSLDRYALQLARMVAETSWFPHPEVVKEIGRAVFPTVRVKSGKKKCSFVIENDVEVAMYDDNTTPEWALFWSHGLTGTRPKGWTIAHVWPTSDDIAAYTHVANLAMVREPFAGLTDKDGPLTGFLRRHAWEKYGWKPASMSVPPAPEGFEEITWRYLAPLPDPWEFIEERFFELRNERVFKLEPLMEFG